MATVDPYKAYSELYQKRTDAINAQAKQQEAEKLQREQQAQETLANANRGVYTSYKQQVNPYGSFASQNNFSSGVSDYYKNASYGTMLQGIGTNQYNYNDAINNSNSLWQNYLAQKAGDEADALNDYNSAVLAQQKYDEEQKVAEQERQEAIRQYNLNLQLQQQKLAEDKRRYDQEWAYQLEQDAKAAQAAASGGSSGGGGSSSRRRSGGGGGNDVPLAEVPTFTPTGDQRKDPSLNSTKNTSDNYANKVVRTEYQPSNQPGYRYRIFYYNSGKPSKVMVKWANDPRLKNKK